MHQHWRTFNYGLLALCVFGLMASSTSVQAQGNKGARKTAPIPAPAPSTTVPASSAPAVAPAAAGAKSQRQTTYDFDDDLVTGDLVRPDGELLSVRKRGNRASLIKIREHFIPEMLKSVENL